MVPFVCIFLCFVHEFKGATLRVLTKEQSIDIKSSNLTRTSTTTVDR